MRIALLTFDDYPSGGIQSSVVKIASYLQAGGHEVLLWCLRPHPEAQGAHSAFRPIYDWPADRPMNAPRRGVMIRNLRRAIHDDGPELCIGFGPGPQFVLALATLGVTRTRLFGAERSYPGAVPLSMPWRAYRRFAVARLDKLVCQTHRSANWYASNNLIKPSKLYVIPNSFDPPKARRSNPPDSLAQLATSKVIACIGRMSWEKGYDDALDAFRLIAEEPSGAKLLLLGDGPLRNQLETRARGLGLSDRVCFHSSVRPLDAIWPLVDIFLLTSKFEGMPNALGEAMAEGKPCVAFDCPTGPSELLTDGIDGFLVPAGEVNLVAQRLRQLLDDPALATEVGNAARDVTNRFSDAKIGALWRELV